MQIAQVGEPILKAPAIAVTQFNSELDAFIAELLDCMTTANGIGIAAPQVFDPRAIMIVASRPNERYPHAPEMAPLVMINPTITGTNEHIEKAWEGCLSVPGIRGLIPRPTAVSIQYQDTKGTVHTAEWDGFLARVFQHEYDHLMGKTWLDRLESVADICAETVLLPRIR
ncbi:peptide deformylase [Echinimonas agarilytica]|uniref:Peptide deformylase n=1 Tax=Echinimonas agarilytica TaxID=1215918 RepID=A0AA42B9R5_9GAMM|nr:peptide deformylase [Echinimonas agarilytica]MCM2681251.1 peptide deformylase [Echinimonas agarilytica]